ncbi:hypothetical protein D9M68_931960 [compost metagenome]
MPEVVHDARAPAQLVPVRRGEPAQWKPLQLPAKDHQQRDTQHEAGDGVADQHQQRGHQIKTGAGTHRLGHTQRHGHEIADEKGPHAETDGHRQLLDDEL